MPKYTIYLEVKHLNKTGGVSQHITVEASSEEFAKEKAIQEFKKSYPCWEDSKITVVGVKKN